MNTKHIFLSIVLILLLLTTCTSGDKPQIKLEDLKEAKRIDITVDGKLFASYCYSDSLEKPILFPIIAADGITVTRGFPLAPRKGEQVDHPHQTGYWFNYGNVNGIDFWGNSKWVDGSSNKYGVIRLKKIEEINILANKGMLKVNHEWIGPDGNVILDENTIFTFSAGQDFRIIDRLTTLSAKLPEVSMPDTKEGAFGIRVSRFLEFPSATPRTFVDASGEATTIPVTNDEGVSGNYISSEGIEGVKVWGTRAKWMDLYGVNGSDTISMVFMDHPSSFNYPTYWHARDYGLFSANPFGVKDFTSGKDSLNFKMKQGETITFKHRLFIKSGHNFSSADIEKAWLEFANE